MLDNFDFDKTPEDKFYEQLHIMNKDIVRGELSSVIDRVVALEVLLNELGLGEDEIEKRAKAIMYSNENIDNLRQSYYLHLSANMIGQHE
jgi:hypothetical protein